MATAGNKRVGRSEKIQLADGTNVELRPLNIKKLKEFMKKFGELQELDPEDKEQFDIKFMDIMVDMSAISLSGDLKDATAYLYMDPEDDEYEDARERWETMIDQDTMIYINEVCGGISLSGGSDTDFQKGDQG